MIATTTQRRSMAAAGAARVHDAYALSYLPTHAPVNQLMGKGSWSIPCTAVATFEKPQPRRSQVNPS
jgi:hypothetical protein